MDPHASIAWLFLLVSVIGLLFTLNALRPIFAPAAVAILSFFAGWLTGELPIHHLAWQLLFIGIFVGNGALQYWPGRVALLLCAVSWVGLIVCFRRALGAKKVLDAALLEGLGDDFEQRLAPSWKRELREALPWMHRVFPFPIRHAEVVRNNDVVFFEEGKLRLRLDVYRRRGIAPSPGGSPILVFVHGGGWVIGDNKTQGLPLLLHLAACGWTCFNITYRLSPRATFPAHIIDVKRALAWVRAHASEYGGDPNFIVLGGCSAGGHLAALAALTDADPNFQPGFETANTRVQGCLAIYGIYDLTDRFGHWPNKGLADLLEQRVMKEPAGANVYREASPLSRIHPDAPPFFIVHGELDTLVPVEEARCFATEMRTLAHNSVVFAELPGAQHAFEIFPSRRTMYWVETAAKWGAFVHSAYQTGVSEPACSDEKSSDPPPATPLVQRQ